MKWLILFLCVVCWGQTFSSPSLSSGVITPADTWVMQEGSGNTFANSSGTANTITAGGTITWGSNGAHFPGTFDSHSANFTNFNPGTSAPWSVSTWVSFDTVNNNEEVILSQLGVSSQGWYIYKNAASAYTEEFGIIIQNVGVSGYASRRFYIAQSANYLYHIVATYDGSGTAAGVNMWINGNFLQPTTIHDNLSGSSTPNAPIYFGSCSCAISSDRHVGYQSSTRTYNRQLTNLEILTLYEAGPVGDTYTLAMRSAGTSNASNFAALDADCSTGAKIGGGTATDNTAKLNAVLLTASSASPLDLVLNGCSATSGLFVLQSGYTTIEGNGWTSGLFVIAGSNAAAVTNSWGLYPTSVTGYGLTPIVLPSKGSNVVIKNLKIEGNRSGPNAIVSDPHGSPWLPGIAISNVNGLTLDTVWIYDAPTYAFIGDNISNVTVLNSRFESPSHAINTDGFHVDGPADHITVSGGYFYTGDDAIALNAPEGYSGTIVNVAITNPGVNTGSLNGLREYGTVQSVTVNGCVLADTSNLGVGSSVRISPATLDAYNCTPPTTGGIALRGSVSLRGLSTTR